MEQAESSKGGDDYVIILRDDQSNVAAIPVADLPAVDISTAEKVSTPSDTAEDKNKSKTYLMIMTVAKNHPLPIVKDNYLSRHG